jgi:hypothetical protein
MRKLVNSLFVDSNWLWFVAGISLGLMIGLPFHPGLLLGSMLENLMPEIFGITFTVLIVDRLYRARDAQRQVKELQDRLKREARSPFNEVALKAIHDLRDQKWLNGRHNLLAEANLENANLNEADLSSANLNGTQLRNTKLERAYLRWTQLVEANLESANLAGANLYGANLRQAHLEAANLTDANLWGADLTNADLQLANLCDANLSGARLAGAKLMGIVCDHDTILPDGTQWDVTTDWSRFTDRQHPDFWLPDEGTSHKPPFVSGPGGTGAPER